MANDYKETLNYWDNVFSQVPEYDPNQKIQIQEIDNGIEWLGKNSKSIIDFGCGSGRVLLRCLDNGVEHVCGIDLSSNAISIATNIVEKFNLENKAKFICGGADKLKEIESDSFSGAILFNIIDNLVPDDAQEVIKQIHRIIKPNGKVLLKLNPYFAKDIREKYEFKEMSNEFYKETTGLYLWNLTEEKIKEIIEPYFVIEKHEEIEFKQYNMINRMYYLRYK